MTVQVKLGMCDYKIIIIEILPAVQQTIER